MNLFGYGVTFFLENTLIVLKTLKDDTEALRLLSDYNYTDITIQEGLAIHKIAQDMESAQIKFHADMISVGVEYKKNYAEARSLFKDYTSIILLEFRNQEDNKLVTLAEQALKERKAIEWLKRAKEFYNYVINSTKVMERISQYNFSPEKLEAALNTVIAAEDAKSLYKRLKGNSEDAITKRDAALLNLANWLRKLLSVSEVAFKPNPQFLEKCGIRVFSAGYKRVSKAVPTNNISNPDVQQPPDME